MTSLFMRRRFYQLLPRFDPLVTLIYLWRAVSASRCEGRGARLLPFMDKKRIVVSTVVFLILAVLVYVQFREWQAFDWGKFRNLSQQIRWFHVLHAVAWIYFGYVLTGDPVEDFSAAGSAKGFVRRTDRPHADRIHRPSIARATGRTHSPLSHLQA